MMKKIQILLLEENRILRDGIAAMLRKEPDIGVSIVHNGSLFSTPHQEAVILLSIVESSQHCLQTVKQISLKLPSAKTVIMNINPKQNDIIDFVEAGVHGFILKDATGSQFMETVRAIHTGMHVLPPQLTLSLFAKIIDTSVNGSKSPAPVHLVNVSKREQEIMSLITEGLSNNEIALKLNLSVFTVKSHVHNILNKLSMNTRIQISKYSHRPVLVL